MSERPRGYALRFEIDATPQQIWEALLAPKLQAIWHPPGVVIDARAGGEWRMRLNDRIEREAHIDVYLPPHRMRLVYMPIPGIASEDTVLVDDIIIDATSKGSTRLCILGSGYPARVEWVDLYQQVQAEWRRACSRLKILVEKEASKR